MNLNINLKNKNSNQNLYQAIDYNFNQIENLGQIKLKHQKKRITNKIIS